LKKEADVIPVEPTHHSLRRLYAVVLVVFAPLSPAHGADSAEVFRFEAGDEGWKPRAESIAVSLEEGVGAAADGRACLRVRGRIELGWNYAASAHRPMPPGRLYRLTAWVRVDKLGPTTPAPYLKCEFVGASPRSSLGQAHTDRYDKARLGQWQELKAEFKAPDEARGYWLALEKGTDGPAEIDARLDEIRLESIARLSVLDQFHLSPFPNELAKVRGVHPRLYLDAAKIARLRKAIKTTHSPLWDELRGMADRAVKRGPPTYRERDNYSGDEQLWQLGPGLLRLQDMGPGPHRRHGLGGWAPVVRIGHRLRLVRPGLG
jgi:hypothetical protein